LNDHDPPSSTNPKPSVAYIEQTCCSTARKFNCPSPKYELIFVFQCITFMNKLTSSETIPKTGRLELFGKNLLIDEDGQLT